MRRSGAEQIPSILLATLSASFGVCLLETTSVFGQVISANSVTGSSSTLVVMLQIVASVFIVIAVYVGSIVTANTFATIIAGRTRTIALYRLIGAIAADQRRSIAREGRRTGRICARRGDRHRCHRRFHRPVNRDRPGAAARVSLRRAGDRAADRHGGADDLARAPDRLAPGTAGLPGAGDQRSPEERSRSSSARQQAVVDVA
jgi:hypothetical protein